MSMLTGLKVSSLAVSGKFLPGKLPPIKFPPWRIPPRKIPTQKIPTRNIPTHIFKPFVFSLLLPLSLIMVKRLYFCLLKMLKLDLMRCIKKNFAACLLLRKCFGYDRNLFLIFIQEMFNFSKIKPHEKEISKEPEKLVKNFLNA